YFDESGRRLRLPDRVPLGQTIAQQCEYYGVRYFIPFSSMHRYQRSDSAWAAPVAASLADYSNGFHSATSEALPPFVRYDCGGGRFDRIDPQETPTELFAPETFGDHWAEALEPGEPERVESYFRRVRKLDGALASIRVRVGGRDHTIRFDGGARRRG